MDTVAITVTAANDAPVLSANTGSTVAEGGTDTIDSSELAVTDVDTTAAQLTYTIGTGPVYGRLELTTAPGVSATTFTQADIATNRLVYVHDGSETTSDSFTFTVNDGAAGTLGTTTMTLTITPVNDTPTITSDGGGTTAAITVAENVSAVTIVTGADVDVPAQALTYSISGGADQALFTINAATGALSFTAPPNFEVATDANGDNVYVVQVQVIDSQGASTRQTIQVTVTDVAEGGTGSGPSAPPTLPPSLIPLPPVPVQGPVPLLPTGPVTPAGSEWPTESVPGVPAPTRELGSIAQAALPGADGATPIRVVFRPDDLTALEDSSRLQDSAGRAEMLASGVLNLLPVETAGALLSDVPKMLDSVSEILMEKLDALAASLEEAISVDHEQHALVARAVAMTGATLSVGFVAWALRSSWFLASCLATLPAWRSFDPLPVVNLSRYERDRNQQDAADSARREQDEFDGLQDLLDNGPPSSQRPSRPT
ncbi:MAG: cadherin domain-containing protein [Gammaproteobacteria bacterium]|nr:cadherin domain-containing protein [Gammaproteobacteria bacterium]